MYILPFSYKKCRRSVFLDTKLPKKCDSVDVGEVGIFVVNGDVYIKELGDGCLISRNEKYKSIKLTENDSIYCCGRVIGVID